MSDYGGKIDIVKDEAGKSLVIINDIRFKGRRGIEWKEVENYSKDTKALKGTNSKAKANAAQAIGELIQVASNKVFSEDYSLKHGNKAKYGWYRYDSRFALPVYAENGELERYNIFCVRLLIRHNQDGRMYLYDILRTKKETSTPPGQ